MPVKYEYLDNKQGVLIRATGTTEGIDLIRTMEDIFKDEVILTNYKYGICDFSDIEKFNISYEQIYSLATIHLDASKLNPQIVVGFAINKPLVYGLVRVWMVYAEMTGWKLNIEKDFPTIKKWVEEKLSAS